MKRVVILSAFLTPFRSGAEACAEEVAARLKQRYSITIVTARLRRDLPRREVYRGVLVWRIGTGTPLDKWLYPLLAPIAARRLKPNLLHAVLETFAGLALLVCRWACPGAKRLLTLQTLNRHFLRGPIVRSPHAVTAISSPLRALAEELGRRDVSVIPNGVPVSDIEHACAGVDKAPGRILFAGRLEPMKGVGTLLRAMVSLPPALHLRVAGDGSRRRSLEELSRSLGLSERVTFLGRLPAPELHREYAEAEIFCGLSRSEAMGNVFLEAQAAGCAVVATDVGGIPDVVRRNETGLLVPHDDPAAAAGAIRTLHENPGLRASLGDAGRKNARAYDWDQIAERYASVYELALSR